MTLDDYIEQHTTGEADNLWQLERETHTRLLYDHMCCGHVQGRLLKMLVTMIRPQRVLELGTYSAYSTLCIAEGLTGDATVDTIELEDELEPFIRRHLNRSLVGHRVKLHIGDAMTVIPTLPGTFDLVYIDANKRHYCDYYNTVKPRLSHCGYIIADNTLWDGKVIDTDADDAQTRGIRDFNDMVLADPDAEVVMLPLRDGLSLIRITVDPTSPRPHIK